MSNATDINVNTARMEAQQSAEELAREQQHMLEMTRHLHTLQERKVEERCMRTFALFERATAYGLKLRWPTEAWRHERMLWVPERGHHCVRPACVAQRIHDAPPMQYNGRFYREPMMHACTGRLCMACTEAARAGEHAPLDATHECACCRCDQFHLPRGTTFNNPENGALLTSSGTCFVCRVSGRAHYCPEDAACERLYLNTDDRTQGYVCRLTMRYKGEALSRVPEYDEERKIATSRINRMRQAETRQEEDNNHSDDYDADADWDFDEDRDLDEEDALQCEEDDGVGEADGESPSGAQYRAEAKLEQDFFRINDIDRIRKYSKLDSIDDIVAYIGRRSKRLASPHAEASPPKRRSTPSKRTPRAVMSADERTEHYLRNPSEREQRLREIVRLLTDNRHKTALYSSALRDISSEANERVDSAKRRSVERELTSSECCAIWYRYALPRLPPAPVLAAKPLNVEPFVTKIEAVWQLVATSPYGTKQQSNGRKHVLSIVKIAFGVLYTIAEDGGYKIDCSLGNDMLHAGEERVSGQDLRNFKVRVLPRSRTLPECIVDKADIGALQRLVVSAVAFDDKTRFQGKRLLWSCLNSKYDLIRANLINAFASGQPRAQCLEAYVEQCQALKC